MAAAGKSRFAVTCALLRRYMRENHRQAQMSSLVQLFEAPPPAATALEEHNDRTLQLFPVRDDAIAQPAKERPEVKTKAPMTTFYEVPREEKVLMRTASLQRFLKKRKLRTSDTKPEHREDSTPSKKQKDATAAGNPFQDVAADPSWLRL